MKNGPATDNIHGHKVERPYVEIRKEIIARAFSSLGSAELDMLSRGTSGMWGDQIIEACRNYVERGIAPESYYQTGTCPINPVNGDYVEFLFKPFRLGRRIEGHGFEAEVLSYFGGARGGFVYLLNQVLTFKPFTPLTILAARAFRIIARKNG